MAQRLWIVSYDVSCPKRWRRVFALMKRKGVHRQLSVFLVRTDAAGQRRLLADLSRLIDPKVDSLRFYFLGSNWKHRVEHIGAKKALDQEGPLIA